MGQAPAILADPVFEGIAVTDTVRSVAAAEGDCPEHCSPRLVQARRRCHHRSAFRPIAPAGGSQDRGSQRTGRVEHVKTCSQSEWSGAPPDCAVRSWSLVVRCLRI
jgi:hypothetical protein